MVISGKDLADKIGCAPSTLSEATKSGYLVNDRWDVQAWAVCAPNGRVKHYSVPNGVAFLRGVVPGDEPVVPQVSSGGDSIPGSPVSLSLLANPDLLTYFLEKEETTRQAIEQAGDRTQLVPDGTDVAGATQNAGMAYAAGKAIEHDTPGACAFWTVGSGFVGGASVYAMTENPWAAVGAGLMSGLIANFVYSNY